MLKLQSNFEIAIMICIFEHRTVMNENISNKARLIALFSSAIKSALP